MEIIIMSNNNPPPKLDLEETELRLGLPNGGGKEAVVVVATAATPASPNANGKRGFEETIIDLKLNLSSSNNNNNNLMEDYSGIDSSQMTKDITIDQVKPPAKAQVVGWPPVRNYRKKKKKKKSGMEEGGGRLVKVSIDGAPYLRKVDLKMFKSYQQLSDALGKMFNSFTTGNDDEAKGMIDFMNENKLNNYDYVPTYQDKDADWMLVGDVPWEMFVESCNRLRIIKHNDALGLAPARAMEKCKNRG